MLGSFDTYQSGAPLANTASAIFAATGLNPNLPLTAGIELNDNPTTEAGIEDSVPREELYWHIMKVFLRRLDRRKEGD